jgi:MFS transporter, OFA family, oxalate/formate antiporter
VVVAAAVIGVSHGAYAALLPAVVADRYGPDGLGRRLGVLYTASAVGALLGPLGAGAVTAATSGPSGAIALTAAASVLARAMLPTSALRPVRYSPAAVP